MQQPTPTPQKSHTGLIIGLSIGGVVLFSVLIFFVVFLFAFNTDRNWSLGVGKQQSNSSLGGLSDAVASELQDYVIDTDVRNANTSGTPFGHTVDIRVLIPRSHADKANHKAIVTAVAKAIASTKKDDSYRLWINSDINPNITGGDGSEDQPLTTAKDVSSSGIYPTIVADLQDEFQLSKTSRTDLILKLRDAQRIASEE